MAEHGFTIAGDVCPVVALHELTMGERVVLFENCGIAVEDFRRMDGETDDERHERIQQASKHPGYLLSMLHIAYARRHPELSRQQVANVVENVNAYEAFETVGDDEENPPTGSESTTSPEPISETSPSRRPTSSGLGSSASSARPDDDRSRTTDSRSRLPRRFARVT